MPLRGRTSLRLALGAIGGPREEAASVILSLGLGLAVLAVLLVGGVAELWELTRRTEAAVVVGSWLVAKDWRDLFPSRRNTARWSLLLHRVPRE